MHLRRYESLSHLILLPILMLPNVNQLTSKSIAKTAIHLLQLSLIMALQAGYQQSTPFLFLFIVFYGFGEALYQIAVAQHMQS